MRFFKNKSFSNLNHDHIYLAMMSDEHIWGFDIPSTTFVALLSFSKRKITPVYKNTLKGLVRENEN